MNDLIELLFGSMDKIGLIGVVYIDELDKAVEKSINQIIFTFQIK